MNTHRDTVVAVYDNFETADLVIRALVADGFDRIDIGVAANNVSGTYNHLVTTTAPDLTTDSDVSGSEGGGFGAVVALSAIAIPGIGPIIAAGPLVALLGGATGAVVGGAVGAVTGSIAASLINLGIPDAEAEHYAESVRRGHALVTVTVTNEEDATTVSNVLRRYNPLRVKSLADQWREKSWSGFDPLAEPYTEAALVTEQAMRAGAAERYAADDTIQRFPPVIPAG